MRFFERPRFTSMTIITMRAMMKPTVPTMNHEGDALEPPDRGLPLPMVEPGPGSPGAAEAHGAARVRDRVGAGLVDVEGQDARPRSVVLERPL